MDVLISCPPMLGAKNYFEPIFDGLNWNPITPEFTQIMSEDQLCEILPRCDGWIIGDDPATRRVFEAGKGGRLRAAVKWGVGVDNVDFKACEDLQIPISNTPGMFGNEVADLALGYLLALSRDILVIDRHVRGGDWFKPQGQSLTGKIAGVVGFGDIGQKVCQRLNAFGIEIVVWDPLLKENGNRDFLAIPVWPEGVGECDFIIFTCALNAKNRHMFNKDVLSRCKRGASIINVARGPLIDEKALLQGLKGGVLTSAALDVFEFEPIALGHPLLEMDNVILGSHNGSNTQQAVQRATSKAIALLDEFFNSPEQPSVKDF